MFGENGLLSLLAPYWAAASGEPFQPPGYGDTGGLEQLAINAASGGGGGGGPGRSAARYSSQGNRWEEMARRMAANRYGWGNADFRYIDWIIGGGGPNDVVAESGWNPKAVNPSSGAYGIPQILPSAHPGAKLQSDPQGQVRWLLNYIKQRYGSPQDAYAFKSNKGWY